MHIQERWSRLIVGWLSLYCPHEVTRDQHTMVVMAGAPLLQPPMLQFWGPLRNVLLIFAIVLCKCVPLFCQCFVSFCHCFVQVEPLLSAIIDRCIYFWKSCCQLSIWLKCLCGSVFHNHSLQRLSRGCMWFGKAGTQVPVRDWSVWSATFGAWIFNPRAMRRCWKW